MVLYETPVLLSHLRPTASLIDIIPYYSIRKVSRVTQSEMPALPKQTTLTTGTTYMYRTSSATQIPYLVLALWTYSVNCIIVYRVPSANLMSNVTIKVSLLDIYVK